MPLIISISNAIGPFVVCALLLYIFSGWILMFFKRWSVVEKYYTTDFSIHFFLFIYSIMGICVIISEIFITLNPTKLTISGFIALALTCGLIVGSLISYIFSWIIKFRKSIKPE